MLLPAFLVYLYLINFIQALLDRAEERGPKYVTLSEFDGWLARQY
jgi:hypothetical protein